MYNQIFIYNPFDVFSFLTAAVIKSKNDCKVYKCTDNIPTFKENDQIEYLNLVPYSEAPSSLNKTRKGNHVWTNTQKWETGNGSDTEEHEVDIFSNACHAYQYNQNNKGNISNLVHSMYSNNLTMNELIVLYKNLQKAKMCLDSNGAQTYVPFNFGVDQTNRNQKDIFTDNEIQEFLSFIKIIKQKAERNYSIQYVESNSRYYKTIVTFCSDEDYFWLRRLFSLGNKYYANVAVTTNGCVIDTNLDSVKGFHVDLTCHKSIEFFQR